MSQSGSSRQGRRIVIQTPSQNTSRASLANARTGPGTATGTVPQTSSTHASILKSIRDLHDIHDIHDIQSVRDLNLTHPRTQQDAAPPRPAEGADALWDQMQSALAEVELAATGGSRMFGSYHPEVVESLRAKQLALAQAWGRTEGEEVPNNSGNNNNNNNSLSGNTTVMEIEQNKPREVLDEKTEKDITHARKRREANDRYFERVSNGVLDVVAKLEDVAETMREVVSKSKEIWADSGSKQSSIGSRAEQKAPADADD
ncbi:hypothetical protein H112_05108 [Trichophyton rubrum D6]|uniref:Uncharacterized protein n=3 Tax=Trichophyton rubrum TaxID=5551 RepID=A0A178EP46_TRIRU|nr:uncharacterized protein TERG_02860 [Trichophyton rubrum CBS 118892]EZF21939.1 hypothetical protein H100_05131 [Trichophyton rubrum MR850]EZF40989.1 hypothetical protein H102_05117 [Trichophyton rubrum CBS 100081]EZF51614.1 hypothetical protein H103_05118 [Trichophyton rubrum CBS 288.86]EZF62240.1 hypothetical protein H104_05112 [Trichophyton rubrum CBS 289.86]EZF83574.1 hypothetical protein H110_05117 [Trichophyton rubrum MR1448]EZF94227.1 hypothetical protein H113_05159 [Trichophyton rubr